MPKDRTGSFFEASQKTLVEPKKQTKSGQGCTKNIKKGGEVPCGLPQSARRKDMAMLFAMKDGLAYELIPCSDAAMLAVDEELQLM